MKEFGPKLGTAHSAALDDNGKPMPNTSRNHEASVPDEEGDDVSEMDQILENLHMESQRLQRSRKARKKPAELNLQLFAGCGSHVLEMVKEAVNEEKIAIPKLVKKKKKATVLPSILPKDPTAFLRLKSKKKKKGVAIKNHVDLPTGNISPGIRLFCEFDESGDAVIDDDGLVDIEDSDFYLKNSLRFGSSDGRVNDSFRITDRKRLDFLQKKLLLEKMKREEQRRLKKEKKKASKKIHRVLTTLPTPPQKTNEPRKRPKSCGALKDKDVSPPAKRVKVATRATTKRVNVDIPTLEPVVKASVRAKKLAKSVVPTYGPKKMKAKSVKFVIQDTPALETPKPNTSARGASDVPPPKPTSSKTTVPIVTKVFDPDMPVLRSRSRATRRAMRKPVDLEIPTLTAIADVEPLTPEGQEEAMPVLLNMDDEEIDQPVPVVKSKIDAEAGRQPIPDAPVFPSPATANGSSPSSKAAVLKPIKIRRKSTKEVERSSLLMESILLIQNEVIAPSCKPELSNAKSQACADESVNVIKGLVCVADEDTKNDDESGSSYYDACAMFSGGQSPSQEKGREPTPDTISSGSWRTISGEESNRGELFDADADMMNDPNVGSGSSDDGSYLIVDDDDATSHDAGSQKTISSGGWREILGEEAGSSSYRSLERTFAVRAEESGETYDLWPDDDDDHLNESRMEDEAVKGSSGKDDSVDIETIDLPPSLIWNGPLHGSWETTPSTSSVKSASSDASSTDSAKSSAIMTPRRRCDDANEQSPVESTRKDMKGVTASPHRCYLRRRYKSSDEESLASFYDRNFSPSDPLISSPIASQQ